MDRKSFVGVIVVHYSKTTCKNGINSNELFADCLKDNKVKRDVPCQWGILKLFK